MTQIRILPGASRNCSEASRTISERAEYENGGSYYVRNLRSNGNNPGSRLPLDVTNQRMHILR